KQSSDSKWMIDIKLDVQPMRSVVFNCEEFALTGLYDPRYLQSLGEIVPLDARRNAEPQRYCMMLGDEMGAGFVEPDSRSYLLIRYGRIGNRLILLNMSDKKGSRPFMSLENGDKKGRDPFMTGPEQGVGYTARELD